MALTIRRDKIHTYSLRLIDLTVGEVYEGIDGMLYVGCNFDSNDGAYIGAIGLGHNAYIDDLASDPVFTFREVTAVITIN